MSYEYVNIVLKVKWQFKESPHIKVTECKKLVNTKTGLLLKYTTRGFYVNGRYLKRNQINAYIEPIKSSEFNSLINDLSKVVKIS